MSEQDQDIALGKLVREHGEVKQRYDEASKKLVNLREYFKFLAESLTLSQTTGQIANASKAHQILNSMPEDVTTASLRGLITEHTELSAKLQSIRTQLKSYMGD